MAVLTRECGFCGRQVSVTVRDEDYHKYKMGAFVQDAFPYLPADQREVLISGTCGDCWDRYMRYEEGDPNDGP